MDKSRARRYGILLKRGNLFSPSVPGIVPSRILTGINRKAKLMCESAASHTAPCRFISVRARCARFAHNSLMRGGLLFKLFNSRERQLGLGRRTSPRPSRDPPGRIRGGFRVIHGSHRATKWVRSRIFVPRDTAVGDHLDAGYVSRAESLLCIPRFLRNNKLQVAGI